MSSSRILAVALIIPPLLLLQQHLRLRAAFPTLPVPPSLEISTRTDSPALGMGPTPSSWLGTQAGDEWVAVVPRRWLAGAPLDVAFMRAFLGTWPLAIEKRMVRVLVKANISWFARREGAVEGEGKDDEEKDFVLGEPVLERLVSFLSSFLLGSKLGLTLVFGSSLGV